jgi:hypothetical protein
VISKKRALFDGSYTQSKTSRAQDAIQLLNRSKCPLLLGIWGMTGIGKSTIAEAIFYQIGPYFEKTCFLENVGVWQRSSGLVSLQEQLLGDIDKTTEIKIPTIESGRVILKEALRGKRVLLVLDNIDRLEQLNALCESPEWFGAGSKIIITTRDRHLLKEHGVEHVYKVKELDESESLELFNLVAFSQETSREGFAELSRQVVSYSEGLPLALTVLGRHLHSKKVDFWESELHNLKMSLHEGVQGRLESSFTDLNDKEKQIFLDIAYFFIGKNQNEALQTLNNRSTQCTALQISLLEDKSFVTIDENNKLGVHVLLEAMAKDIIKRESSNMTNQVSVCLRLALFEVSPMYGFVVLKYIRAKEAK